MNMRPSIGVSISMIALVIMVGVARSEEKTGLATPEFAAGEYTLWVEATKRVKKRRSVSGSLTLKPLASDFDGWTDVDFLGLGAAMSATAISPTSRDPENPGVLAVSIPPGMGGLAEYLRVPSSGGTVMLLVGTESNRKATRMNRDGGGIALKAQARKAECILGEWSSYGVVHGAEGRFRLCPKHTGK